MEESPQQTPGISEADKKQSDRLQWVDDLLKAIQGCLEQQGGATGFNEEACDSISRGQLGSVPAVPRHNFSGNSADIADQCILGLDGFLGITWMSGRSGREYDAHWRPADSAAEAS